MSTRTGPSRSANELTGATDRIASASAPCGVLVSLTDANTDEVKPHTGTPAASASRTTTRNGDRSSTCAHWSRSTYSSSRSAPAPRSSAIGTCPSITNRPASRRAYGAPKGAVRKQSLDSSPKEASVRRSPRPKNQALAEAADAACTRAVNAAGSVTARSARTLRSTSIPASFRPAMKRL